MRLNSVSEMVGNTPLVRLSHLSPNKNVRIWAKLEGQNPTGSVKDRIALAMFEGAEASGALGHQDRRKIILEPTSGNTGISLAWLARPRGYRIVCVMPESASRERSQLIEVFGGEIVWSPGDKGSNGAVELATEMSQDPKYHMLYQYGNPENPGAHYRTTAPEIARDCPDITHFVSGLGTGGTLMGVGRYLRERRPEVKIYAAEPEQGDLVYGLRSLEDGFIPPIFDERMIDGKIKVNAQNSVKWTQELVRSEGVFAGISAGATVHVARRLAERSGGGDIVCLFADGGWKYLSTELWTKQIDEAAKEVEYMPW